MDEELFTVDGEAGFTFDEAEDMAKRAEEEGREIEILDADGEEWAYCVWCEELHPKHETVIEANMGRLCQNCVAALRSRGEKLTICD